MQETICRIHADKIEGPIKQTHNKHQKRQNHLRMCTLQLLRPQSKKPISTSYRHEPLAARIKKTREILDFVTTNIYSQRTKC